MTSLVITAIIIIIIIIIITIDTCNMCNNITCSTNCKHRTVESL